MKRILQMSLVLLLFLSYKGYAQERTITGTVTSTEDNSALPGVTVAVKGNTTIGTVTDGEGNFTLAVPADASVLIFSYIGMTAQEISIGNRTSINVALTPDTKQLSEVVVTALGIQREEKALGYSVQEIEGRELTQAREVNVVNSLAGRIAGVQITGASGNMGGSSRILIRGANSIAGNNQPLFVVDGIPFDNSNYTSTNQATGRGGYDYGNMAQDINPDDIETISVLKGPSAAALYGTRASNGVILITTKSGKGRKGIGVSVNSGVTFDQVYILPDYQNDYGGGLGRFTKNANGEDIVDFGTDESWGPRLDGRPVRQWYSYYEGDPDFGQTTPWVGHKDNIRDFFETGVTYTNNVSLSGGNDNSTFRLSYTNLDQKFVLPKSNLQRHTINFNGSTKLTDKFSAQLAGNYVHNSAVGRPGTGYDGTNVMQQFNQWSQRQVSMDKLRNYRMPDGSQRTWNIVSETDLSAKFSDNPYWTRYANYQNDSRDRFYGNLTLNYQFNDYLRLTGRVLTDYYTDRREERIAVGSQAISEYSEGVREHQETNTDLILTYDRKFSDFFSLTAYVGANRMYRRFNRNVGTTAGGLSVPNFYNLTNSTDRVIMDDYAEEKQINSVFGNASLGFADMVFVDLTLRNDWSSTLPKNNNSYLYPSVGTSFVFTQLGALRDFNILSFGKIRASWAQVGSDTDPFRLATTYVPKPNFGSNPNFTVPNSQNNPGLKPETTTSWEVGADLRFLDNRIGLDFTYYDNSTRDQIIGIDVSPTSGYGRLVVNAGEITNKGIELMLRLTPVKLTNGLQWDVTLNWARNRNKVVELIEGVDSYQINTAPFSVSVVARKGEPYGTILGSDFVYHENGQKIVQANGTYARTAQQVPIGNAMPDWTGGINNMITYKGVSLSFLIDAQQGADLFSISNMFGKYSGMFQETVAGNIRELGVIADGVTADGSPNTTRMEAADFFQSNYNLGAASTYDASFVKLREVRIGYTLPNKIFGNVPFRNVSISFVGRNLAILHKNIPHLDPEAALSTGNFQGVEGAQLPSIRSLGFNLNFNL